MQLLMFVKNIVMLLMSCLHTFVYLVAKVAEVLLCHITLAQSLLVCHGQSCVLLRASLGVGC